jgi:transmembrane sensor
VPRETPRAAVTTLHFQTRHGEQLTQRLADNSVVHLNTDTSVSVRYDQTERLITLTAGQADFEVVHERDRKFRVLAGPATAVAVGTNFDVRLEADAAVITVVEGRVAVGTSPPLGALDANSNRGTAQAFVQVGADQQIRVTPGQLPAVASAVDSRSATAWLQRQIVFEREPLERVAGEFNRYAPKPIEIDTPALRKLEISGVFATDDPEAFIAFLRSLEGVRVEVGRTAVHVSTK